MPRFAIQALKIRELEEAWPIVRSSGSHANVDWWIANGDEIISDGGGVLVARDPDGRTHGVATFKVPLNETKERVVTVPMLITFELSRNAPARSALLHALKRIATKQHCTHIILPTAAKCDPLAEHLRAPAHYAS